MIKNYFNNYINCINKNLSFEDVFYYIFTPIFFIFSIHGFLSLLDLLNYKTPEIESCFILNADILNPLSIFLSNYTHFTFWSHLMVNVFNYFVVSLLILFLIQDKKQFKKLMIFSLLILPFILGISDFCMYNCTIICGFSGIVSCLIGFLPILSYYYNKKELKLPLTSYAFVIPIVLNLTIYLIYNKIIIGYIFFVLLLLLTYLELKNYTINKKEFNNKFNEASTISIFVFTFAICLCYITFFTLVPTYLVNRDFNTGYLIHFIGWINGIIISFIIFKK